MSPTPAPDGGWIADHEHGKVASTSCRHPLCRAATARYLKRWRYDREHGVLRLATTEAARLHIALLLGQGWSIRSIAYTADVKPGTVSAINTGAQTKARRPTIDAILGVDPGGLPTWVPGGVEPNVSRVGTIRRLQALMRIGHSAQTIAEAIGEDERWVHNKMHQQGRWVRLTTHRKVAAAYDALWRKPGTSDRTRRRAEQRGYPGPLDWDDIDHDLEPDLGLEAHALTRDVTEWRPAHEESKRGFDHAAVQRFLDSEERPGRHWTHDEGQAIVDALRRRGYTTTRIERLGFNIERYDFHREEGSA